MGFEINFKQIDKSELSEAELLEKGSIRYFPDDYLYEENNFKFCRLGGYRKMMPLYDALVAAEAILFIERVTWVLEKEKIQDILSAVAIEREKDPAPFLTDYDEFIRQLTAFENNHDFDSTWLLFTAE